MLAVPFRAKDMPSLRAEFGHPDIAVTLTCLSYYYTGLTQVQLLLCFELLLKQDNPTLEYESWVLGLHSIPESLRHLSGINTESAEQVVVLQQLFAFNKAVVDFYLSRVVFPKEAKAFPEKLTCSGWDLAQEKTHLTTGFSGTNDNRYLLPSSIVQHDLDYQRSTNARVLSFLLRKENNRYRLLPPGQKVREFISVLIAEKPEVRVLLDVGAQMLELKNQELAEAWLRAKRDAEAAVFVNDDDELVLHSRDADLLREISSLSTRRNWYPAHLRKMQTVSWSSLSSLAQHHGFHAAAESIMDYGVQLSAFSEGSPDTDFEIPLCNNHLLERASIRASAVYPNQFSLPLPHGDMDVNYASRDVPGKGAEEKAFNTAFMVHQWPSSLPVQQNLLRVMTQWEDVQGIGECLSLRYSKGWLKPSFPDVFLSAYDLCRSATKTQALQLAFTLASVAYSSDDIYVLIPTLLAFATVSDVRSMDGPPEFTSYDLSDGFIPSDAVLGYLITSCAIDFERSGERHLVAMPEEDEKALGRRRYSAFEDKCASEKQVLLSKLNAAWPCEDPPKLSRLQASCYNLDELSGKLRSVFHSCWKNRSLKQHLRALQVILNRTFTHHPPSKLPSQYAFDPCLNYITSPTSSVDAQHLFNRKPPVIRTLRVRSSQVLPKTNQRGPVSPYLGLTARLKKLINNFRDRGSNNFHRKYADDLDRSSCWKNRSLKQHLRALQVILNRTFTHHPPSKLPSQYAFDPCLDYVTSPTSSVDAQHLFNRKPPVIRTLRVRFSQVLPKTNQRGPVSPSLGLTARLQKLINNFRDRGSNNFHRKYADDLDRSSRDGTVEPLVSSPFSQQLDQCIVYLDDAHTRGTDLKLPSGFRAAVTLGPKVTKDRLTQGCMRMRKLGNGHSVVFFAPIEVDRSIRSAAKKTNAGDVNVADILHWAMLETCTDIQMRASHWSQQGSDFKERRSAWVQFSPTLRTSISTLKTAWLQPEERTLEEMYAPRNSSQPTKACDQEIQRKCKELCVLWAPGRAIDEEQEREVIHEVERERQVQRPPKVEAASHVLHPDVRRFVETGKISVRSPGVTQAVSSLVNTTVEFPERGQWAKNLLVTQSFALTVSTVHEADEYLRPVSWVVSSNIGRPPMLLIMSPDEVNELLPAIHRSKAVHLSIYTPRTSKTMQACDDLQLYRVPSTPQLTPLVPLICQLNLFAGQLYFSNYEMYLWTCNFLGLNGPDLEGKDLVVESDGFIREENRPAARASTQFQKSIEAVKGALSPTSDAENALYNAGLWPRVTPNFIFSHMASVSGSHLGNAWRMALVRLSQILLQLQRSRRMLVFAAKRNWVEFIKELENEECERFHPESCPDWFLIQSFIVIVFRSKVKVALEMMSPSTGKNTSLQLNMGEGKSYVIVPLVAAALSDSKKLVRVIVLKSLSAQMFQLLVERLSGLAQRRIFYVPFSRSLSIDSSKVQMYRDLMQECMDTRGILLVQPDHILSFELMAVDRQLPPRTWTVGRPLSPRSEVADAMLQAQLWLDGHTRDILDESDEILHVRYQLVYTIGVQRSLQGHPERWTTTQQVLTLVAKHAARVKRKFPSDSDISESIHDRGTFPFIRILHPIAGAELVQWIAQDITSGALENLSFDQASLTDDHLVKLPPGNVVLAHDAFVPDEEHSPVPLDRSVHAFVLPESGAAVIAVESTVDQVISNFLRRLTIIAPTSCCLACFQVIQVQEIFEQELGHDVAHVPKVEQEEVGDSGVQEESQDYADFSQPHVQQTAHVEESRGRPKKLQRLWVKLLLRKSTYDSAKSNTKVAREVIPKDRQATAPKVPRQTNSLHCSTVRGPS
ncbi:hypothetical protein M405DRAFT_839099 [Rhizopogon salebrosus TDB-379]|nr:hypothetical protein M405DRAFT_839099 [Rhizopogon salebrosus TDB-379]